MTLAERWAEVKPDDFPSVTAYLRSVYLIDRNAIFATQEDAGKKKTIIKFSDDSVHAMKR